MQHSFTLPGVTPSQNQYERWHWCRRHEERNRWHGEVLYGIGRKSPAMASQARVHIVRVANRLIDHPNVAAPCKPILDALVEYGWLKGDGPNDLIGFATDQRKCGPGEEPHMEITIAVENADSGR